MTTSMIRRLGHRMNTGALLTGIAVAGAAGVAHADPAYTIKIDAPSAQKAARAKAHVHITPSSGFHMNKEFPTSFTVMAPAGVTVDKGKLSGADIQLAEAGADFDIAFVAADAGKKTIEGELKFAVCSANSCDPKREKLSFVVEVK